MHQPTRIYLRNLKSSGLRGVPHEVNIDFILKAYDEIDELRAENKFLADTAAKLAKELKQADKLADALESMLPLAELWIKERPHVNQLDNCATFARAALDDYKS